MSGNLVKTEPQSAMMGSLGLSQWVSNIVVVIKDTTVIVWQIISAERWCPENIDVKGFMIDVQLVQCIINNSCSIN